MKKLLIPIMVFAMFCTLQITSVHAAPFGISLNPAMVEKQVKSGEQYTQTVMVTNTSDQPVVVYNTVRDFTSKDQTGTALYVQPMEADATYSISKWIKINDTISLGGGETKPVNFEINVPKNATVGGHYGTVFFQPRLEKKVGDQSTPQIATNALIGMHILLTVDGEISKKIEVQNFAIAKEQGISDEGINFEALFKNSGNVHVAPKGRIEIYDEKGAKLTNIGTLQQKDKTGTIFNQVSVDFIPFNQQESKALPNQLRKINDVWKFNKDTQLSGEYTAKYVMDAGNDVKDLTPHEIKFNVHKNITIDTLRTEPAFASQTPITFQTKITNAGTVLLHPKAKFKIYNLFGNLVHESDIPMEGELAVNASRDVQTVWQDGTIQTLVYYPEVAIYDTFGTLIAKHSTIAWFISTPVVLIVGLLLLVLIISIIFAVRKWTGMKREIRTLRRRRKL